MLTALGNLVRFVHSDFEALVAGHAADDLFGVTLVVTLVLSLALAGAIMIHLSWVVSVEGDSTAFADVLKVADLWMSGLGSVVAHGISSGAPHPARWLDGELVLLTLYHKGY